MAEEKNTSEELVEKEIVKEELKDEELNDEELDEVSGGARKKVRRGGFKKQGSHHKGH